MFNPYNHELAKYGTVPTEYKSLREYLYAIGGARMQSFSDFIVENWFDYCQIVADLAARKLPMHTYTKEIALAKLFGMTGIKINMSLIPDIDRTLGKEYAGLTRNARGELELIWADKDRFKKTGGKSYMQSIYNWTYSDEQKAKDSWVGSGNPYASLTLPLIFIIILDILHYITDFAVKYSTKHIYCVGADTLIPFQSSNLPGTDIVLLDKGILCDAFLFQYVPQVIVRNHSNQPPSLLDMITECGV